MSVAAVKSMHLNELITAEQSMTDHCAQSHHKVNQHSHAHHSQSMQDCHQQIAHVSVVHQTDCQECSSVSCQPSMAWLDLQLPRYQMYVHAPDHTPPNIPYRVQFPAGYGHDILRPPKSLT